MGYYYCEICRNFTEANDEKSATLSCCGQKMHKCEINCKDDEFADKHVPVYRRDGDMFCIKIGEVLHPSSNEHHINFIELITDKGTYKRKFEPLDKPECCFMISFDEKPKEIIAYCNIHGLWKVKVDS